MKPGADVINPRKRIPVGATVRLSDHRLAEFRNTNRGFDYIRGPERTAAEESLARMKASRGVVTAHNGYGYAIHWEPSLVYPNGHDSSTISYWIEEVKP